MERNKYFNQGCRKKLPNIEFKSNEKPSKFIRNAKLYPFIIQKKVFGSEFTEIT